jgi:hypothetical protein
MKKIEIQMLLYTLTKNFIEVQGNMLMHLDHIVLQNDGPRHHWWPRHSCGAKETKVQSLLPTYIISIMYFHIYIL